MEYPDENNDNVSPPPNHGAKRKRKTNNTAAARRGRGAAAAAAAAARYDHAMPGSSTGSPSYMFPPVPFGFGNDTMIANNPFDDSPAPGQRAPPPRYPGSMDFMMPHPAGMPHQQPMNLNYAAPQPPPNVGAPGNFGHEVGPRFNTAMTVRMPARLMRGAPAPRPAPPPRGDPPPYHDGCNDNDDRPSINTLSRMHMSMGNVQQQQQQQHQRQSPAPLDRSLCFPLPRMNNPTSELFAEVAGALMEEPPSSRKRPKPPSLCIPQGPVMPYRPNVQYGDDGEIRFQPPMSHLDPRLIGSLPYVPPPQLPPPGPRSILHSQLTNAAHWPPPHELASSNAFMPRQPHFLPGVGQQQQQQQLGSRPPSGGDVCASCQALIDRDQDPIVCALGCNYRFHRVCIGLSKMAYNLLQSTESTRWICDACANEGQVPPILSVC